MFKKSVLIFLVFFGICFAKGPILIQAAMDIEMNELLLALKDKKETNIAGYSFWQGHIDGYPVVLSRTLQGMVNASAATAIGIEHFKPAFIINQGTAGGHDSKVHRGDIILSSSLINIGAYKIDHAKKGIHPTKWQVYTPSMRIRDTKGVFIENKKGFKADKYLLSLALKVAKDYKKNKVFTGVIASGDQWNRELDRIKWLNKKYKSLAEEMEGSASAQVAKAFNIPFLGIRILSNTDVQGESYDASTANDCQAFVLAFAKALIKEN